MLRARPLAGDRAAGRIGDAEQRAPPRALRAQRAAERSSALLAAIQVGQAALGGVDAAALALHDYRIDWLSAVLNQIYRRHGAEGLAAAQLAWRTRTVARPDGRRPCELDDPVGRARNWSFFLASATGGRCP